MVKGLNQTELTVLIVEDDDGHADLIIDNLLETGIKNKIIRFKNGLEAWDFFNGRNPEYSFSTEDSYLLLLDIKMPKMSGIELLKRIKENEVFKTIPVIMLTTTDDDREIKECYRLGCNSYITKPIDFQQFSETLKRIGLFILIIKVSNVDII